MGRTAAERMDVALDARRRALSRQRAVQRRIQSLERVRMVAGGKGSAQDELSSMDLIRVERS